MDQDIFIKEDQSDPLNIQGNEIIPSESNDKIDPMSDCIAQINDYKHPLDYCDINEMQDNSNTIDIRSTDLIFESLTDEQRPYVCPTCNGAFKKKRHLDRHIASVHEDIRPFPCSLCDKKFRGNSELQRHIGSVHEETKPFPCSLCEKTFSQNANLKRHIEWIHEKKKPFSCPICGRGFSVKSDVKKHIEFVHEGKKPFQCNICPKKFTESRILKRHIATVHEIAKSLEEGDIACDICNAIYKTQAGMDNHIAQIHGNYECVDCKKSFTNKYNMRRHIELIHEEKKPPAYCCPICAAKFMNKQGMKKHILSTHEGVKPFECDVCHSRFSQGHGLKKHKARFHDPSTANIKENNIDLDGAPIIQEHDINPEIKQESFDKSEATPIQNSTSVDIKCEKFDFADSPYELENENITCEIKEEIFDESEATPTTTFTPTPKPTPKVKPTPTSIPEPTLTPTPTVFIKQECDFADSQNEREYGMIAHGIKEEFFYDTEASSPIQGPLENWTEYSTKSHEGKPKKGICARKLKCKMCDDTFFISREELNEHMITVHEGEKPFSCTLCGKSYTEEPNLVKHIKKFHEGIKSIQCSLCSFQCATKAKLNTHFSRVHEGKEPTEVQCTLCPFKCKNKAKLNLHFSRVHDEEKEFKCRDCSSSFSKQNQLTMHIMKYHESQTQHTFFQSW